MTNTTKRQKLYDSEVAKARAAGRGDIPICNICDCPVGIGQAWHESHDPDGMPKALGGTEVGIAHDRCNLDHGAKVVTPFVARMKRIRAKHTGAYRSQNPLPGGRNSNLKKKMDGTVVDRSTGQPLWGGRR
jgi:hypothetical protein